MSTIKLSLKNYKQYTEKEFESTEGNLIAFLGSNGTGKSTALQAIQECLTAKNFVLDPIRHGAEESNVLFKYTNLEGNPMQISISIQKEGVYSFTAGYIKNGKVANISTPKTIQELVGIYYPLSTSDVLNMIKYSESRKKFIDTYLLPLLGEVKQKRLAELQTDISSKENKSTKDNSYFKRREKQSALLVIDGELKAAVITDEDKELLTKKQLIIDTLEKFEKEYKDHVGDPTKRKDIEQQLTTFNNDANAAAGALEYLESKYAFICENVVKEIQAWQKEEVEKQNKTLDALYDQDKLTKINDKIVYSKGKQKEIELIEKRLDNKEIKERQKKVFDEVQELNTKIEKAKEEIKLIYKNSALPAGLEIGEDTLSLNGFVLDETTTSTTETQMCIIELLCQLNTSGFVNIGDWGLIDAKNRKKILELAKKNNYMFLGQEVVQSQEEVTCETLIIN